MLTDAEIVAFWAAADAHKYAALFKLLLLTGARLNEVAGMRRAELSADGATWTIPGSRTKNKRVHVLTLPLLARELIRSVDTTGDLIFPSRTGMTPIGSWTAIKRRSTG